MVFIFMLSLNQLPYTMYKVILVGLLIETPSPSPTTLKLSDRLVKY